MNDNSLGRIFSLCLAILMTLAGSACSEKSPVAGSKHEDPLLRGRREKDLAFKSKAESPIPDEDKARFQGLSYFDPNPRLKFRVRLNRHPNPRNLKLATNTGEMRDALRYGYFEFQVQGKICRLQVYRTEEDQGNAPHLFVPFRDSTSGRTTYAAGRYLDFRENTTGYYDLDFNMAYNPYCAYGKEYSCPLPPLENTLPVPIEAGEKNYPLARESSG